MKVVSAWEQINSEHVINKFFNPNPNPKFYKFKSWSNLGLLLTLFGQVLRWFLSIALHLPIAQA